ncbi:hypothetical protein CNAG_00119 [Cryptococcus neoformans var. grubii H99]|uniref:Uncharacterized protein n=1 Tax=Cryptococcus neoformans (strain H99 / ATCC 208821 / CBS 10515 / FGSC 9487) TaxID=235443 RepID=J9VKP2_CRYN9|nr:hypothetical protein CNAG_00119 [Cryptococcus neoformans var. grubii H99]AFR92255.2 hypothetical protein CNAG_00119 [Cryptococcus neoformans var. grubii H99]AUB21663.1 hypothetical protein CKF44_00119 [Cryptococcus neoformans var. grubii]|eukprot:XP_012046181.1 hypothetical protein CNAG_00119 [Cryptococcus neoformans var. grubii H99]
MADITPPSSQQNTPQRTIDSSLPNPDPAAMDVDLDEGLEDLESIASEGSNKILIPSGAERADQVGQAVEADAEESGDEGDEEIEAEEEAGAEEKGKVEKKGKAPLGGPSKKRTKRAYKGQSLPTQPHSHAPRPRPRTEGPNKADGSLFDSEIVARWNADFGDVLSSSSSNTRAAPVPAQAAQS